MAKCIDCGNDIVRRKTCGIRQNFEFVSKDKGYMVWVQKGKAPLDITILTKDGQVVTGRKLNIKSSNLNQYMRDVYEGWPLKKHECAAGQLRREMMAKKAVRAAGY